MRKEIIDLWEMFQSSLDNKGNMIHPDVIQRICDYIYEIPTIYAYQFYDKLLETYGVEGIDRFFLNEYHGFYHSLVNEARYSDHRGYGLTFKIKQDFLDNTQRVQLLTWLEEYIFHYCPEKYLPFVTAILCDKTAAGLFSLKNQRALFDLVITQAELSQTVVAGLKQRYLTEEEKTAEQEAKEAARQKAEQQALLQLTQELQGQYAEKSDGSFSFDEKFLDQYRYQYQMPKMPIISANIVAEHLEEHLSWKAYQLSKEETVHFLTVCAELMNRKVMTFQEVKTHILEIKECKDHAGNSD